MRMLNMFLNEMEAEAITRIQKFAKIASVMGYEIGVGFSGGKDSLVVYDLCKRAGIDCKFYFNHALEDLTTLRYIRENFPDVIWRRTEKGFFEYLQKEKKGMFPTFQFAWCCEAYKHNAKFIDNASIVGKCGSAEWFIPIEELEYLVTYPTSGCYQGCNGYWYEDDFDCGTNEELFLALAALRDDNDYLQWFVSNKKEWILCEKPKWYQEHITTFGFREWHKATVKELIEHFKN